MHVWTGDTDQHHGAGVVAGVKGLLIGLGLAHRLNGHIHAMTAGDVTDGLHRLGPPRVNRVRGTKLFGPLEFAVIHVHGDNRLRPGQSATVDDYRVTYEKATAQISPAEQRLSFGSVLAVTKDGKPYATLYPSRNYYAGVGDPTGGGPVRSFFEGEATSEVGRRTTVGGDLWTAMQPDLTSLNPLINGADRHLEKIARGVSPQNAKAGQALGFLQGLAIRSIEPNCRRSFSFRFSPTPGISESSEVKSRISRRFR